MMTRTPNEICVQIDRRFGPALGMFGMPNVFQNPTTHKTTIVHNYQPHPNPAPNHSGMPPEWYLHPPPWWGQPPNWWNPSFSPSAPPAPFEIPQPSAPALPQIEVPPMIPEQIVPQAPTRPFPRNTRLPRMLRPRQRRSAPPPLPEIPVTIPLPQPAPEIPTAEPIAEPSDIKEDIIEINRELTEIKQVETALEKQQEAQQIWENRFEDIIRRVLNEIEQKNGTNRPEVPTRPALLPPPQ